MGKHRSVNTKFWNDAWVRDELNPLDRYLFLYFITNEHTNISGIYEIPLTTIAYETGLDKDDLRGSMLKRLKPRVFYYKNWVILVNFPKHQNLKSEDVIKGIYREFDSLPKDVQVEAMSRGWGDGLGIAPGTKPNYTILNSGAPAPQEYSIQREENTERVQKTKPKYPNAKTVFSWFPKPEPSWAIDTTQLKHAELLWGRGEDKVKGALRFATKHKDEDFCPKVNKPSDLERKWNDLATYKP